MFGCLRLMLAFLVVLSHLVGSTYLQHFGYYAVRAFFLLSGFLMTASLNDVYRFDARRFWSNRLLRLLPPYYIACLLTLAAVAYAPAQAAAFIGQWRAELLWHDALTDLVVLPLHHMEPHFRLVPTAWSLAVEFEMYLLLFMFAARSRTCALACLVAGMLYHAIGTALGVDIGFRYFGAPSAMLPFALGALIYFARKDGGFSATPWMATAALAAWIGNAIAAGTILPASYIYGAGYYIDTCIFAVVVAGLIDANPGAAMRAVDLALGELAYPVFLIQWLAAFLTAIVLMPGQWRGWTLTLVSIPVTLVMASGLAMLTRRLIDPIRARIRGRMPVAAAPQPDLAWTDPLTAAPQLAGVAPER
jgi:peptidoglycan/LPS O-acetylase OafA/YrhL